MSLVFLLPSYDFKFVFNFLLSGVPCKPGMTRDDLFYTNASIVVDLYTATVKVCPKAMIAIISICIALTFIKDERDKPNPRTDTTNCVDVDTISKVKKYEVRCYKLRYNTT